MSWAGLSNNVSYIFICEKVYCVDRSIFSFCVCVTTLCVATMCFLWKHFFIKIKM